MSNANSNGEGDVSRSQQRRSRLRASVPQRSNERTAYFRASSLAEFVSRMVDSSGFEVTVLSPSWRATDVVRREAGVLSERARALTSLPISSRSTPRFRGLCFAGCANDDRTKPSSGAVA